MNMLNPPLRILIVACLCVLALIVMVVREGMARTSGTEVLLAMEAVDPRSLLSGHFVTIALRDDLGPSEPCPTINPDQTWIALSSDGRVHRFAGAAPSRIEALEVGQVAARGSVTCSAPIPPEGAYRGSPGTVTLDLGVTRFYINQSEAERIDRLLRTVDADARSPVNAILSIGADGRARLKGLEVKGERLELNWL